MTSRSTKLRLTPSLLIGCVIFFCIYKANDKVWSVLRHNLLCSSSTKPVATSDTTPLRLIVGYMRGGSSVTGDIVRHTADDFYIFEPLHGISQATRKYNTTQFLNGTTRSILTQERNALYTDLLYHWFTSNFDHIDLNSLTNPFLSIYTPEHGKYYDCITGNHTESRIQIVKDCITLLNERCRKAKSRTIKTIRTTVSMAGKLLKWLPNLKIIHLIRDPRGIINSRFEQHLNDSNELSVSAKAMCNSIYWDLADFSELERCHQGQMMRVIYEDLCQNPNIVVPSIYSFFGVSYTQNVRQYVKRIFDGPLKKCHYCTDRGKAISNAYRWKSVIKEETLKIIDYHCSSLYSKLGYQHLEYDILNITHVSWLHISTTL